MPDRSTVSEYPYSGKETSVASAETYTVDTAKAQLFQVYIDHADGGTATLGGGDPVPVPGQEWHTLWIQAPHRNQGASFDVTPTTTCDVYDRVL